MMRKKSIFILAFLSLIFIQSGSVYAQIGEGDDVQFFYKDSTSATPTDMTAWNISSDTTNAEKSGLDSTQNYKVITACDVPNKNQTVIVTADHTTRNTYAQIYNKSGSFGNLFTVTTNNENAGFNYGVDCASEDLTGKVIIVTNNDTATGFDQQVVWNGTAFTGTTMSVDPSRITHTRSVFLESRKGSNEIIWYGDTGFNQTFFGVWNSSSQSFYDLTNLTGQQESLRTIHGIQFSIKSPVACSFESVSGRAICLFVNASDNSTIGLMVRNATESGSGKQFYKHPLAGFNTSNPQTIQMESNPTNNEIAVSIESNANLTFFIWNGTNLTSASTVSTAMSTGDDQEFMHTRIAYRYFTDNSTSQQALICYHEADTDTTPDCELWDGTTLTTFDASDVGENMNFDSGLNLVSSISGTHGNRGYWAFLATTDGGRDINVQNFNSTTWANLTEIETNDLSISRGRFGAVWIRYDIINPVFRNTNQQASLIGVGDTNLLNTTTRDNFQKDCTWLETNETGQYINYTDPSRYVCYSQKGAYFDEITFLWENDTLTGGAVGWRICTNDTRDNRACSERLSFSIPLAPTVTIINPANTTYSNASQTYAIDLNFTVNAHGNTIDECWYRLNNTANQTLASCANTSLSIDSGWNNITVAANNTNGAGGFNTVFFSFRAPQCTPTQGQDWNLEAADNCAVSGQDYNVGWIYITGGSGTFTVTNSNITSTGCTIKPASGQTISIAIGANVSWANAC